jgi:O-antigen/teichoic acid export membrane protein
MSPVNIILLPKASKMVHEKNYVLLRSISYQLLFASIGIGVAVMLVVAFFGQFILQLFNVNNIAEASVLLKIIFAGIIGFSVFSVIRSIIDAYDDRARVTSIIVLAFLFFLLSLGLLTVLHLFTIQNVLVVFVISINMLGLLTFLSLVSILKSIRT